MSSPSIQNQAEAVIQPANQGLQPVQQQEDNSVYDGPDYAAFRGVIDKASVLDGNVIIRDNKVVKVGFGSKHGLSRLGLKGSQTKADAIHVATPQENRKARESLYMAIKGKLEQDNGGVLNDNVKTKLLAVAEELGVTLDSKFNRIKNETISDDLSRMEERYIFDLVEGRAVLKEGAESKLGVIQDLGIKLTTDQFEKLFYRAAARITEKLSPELAKSKLADQINDRVEQYVLAYKGKLPKGTTEERENELAAEIKQFFKYESGDIFGGGRQRVSLDLNSLAERLADKFKLEKKNEAGTVSYQKKSTPVNDNQGDEEAEEVVAPGEKPQLQAGLMEKILPKASKILPKASEAVAGNQNNVEVSVSFANDTAKSGLSTLFQKITHECNGEKGNADATKILDALTAPESAKAFEKLCRAVREHGENAASMAPAIGQLADIAGEEFALSVQAIIANYNKGNGSISLQKATEGTGFSDACANLAKNVRQIAVNNLLADVIFDKDVYQFKEGQEANGRQGATPRIVQAFNRNYSAFMELCKAAGGVQWEERDLVNNAFERLKKVAGADFARSIQDTLRRFVNEIGGVGKLPAAGGLTEVQQNVLSTLVRRDRLEEKIDEGLAYVIRDSGGLDKVVETLQKQCGIDDASSCNANELFLRDAIGVCIRKMDTFQARKMFSNRLRGTANLQEKDLVGVSMLKGAGPALIKMLQGCMEPKNASEEVKTTLHSVTNKMPTMSRQELEEQMNRVFTTLYTSDESLRQIEVLDSELGSASIAQTLRCRLVYEGKDPEEVVIKLIKGEARAEFEREKANIKAEFESNSANIGSGSKEVFYSFVKSIEPEFDLVSEQVNALNGLLIYGDKPGEDATYEFKLAGGALTHTVKTKTSVSSVNLLLKKDYTMKDVQDKVAKCVKQYGKTDPVQLHSEMCKIAKEVCQFSSEDCIIEKVAVGQPVDRILERMGSEVQAMVAGPNPNSEENKAKAKALQQNLVDLKRSLLEVSKSFSDGVFTNKSPVVAFHGDFNGGNLIYNEATKQMTIIDYGKGAMLTKAEADAIQKMFGILSRNPTKGNEEEILKAYAEVLVAEKARIMMGNTLENIAKDPFKKTEIDQIDRTLELISNPNKTDASKAEYAKLLLTLDEILHTPDSSSDALKKIANPSVSIDNQFTDRFYAALQNHNLATPVAFFDFFGTVGKLGKSIALIDNQLKELDTMLGVNKTVDKESIQNDIKLSLGKLFDKNELGHFTLLPNDLDVKLTDNTVKPDVTCNKTDVSEKTTIPYSPYVGNYKPGIFMSDKPELSFDISGKAVTIGSAEDKENSEYSTQANGTEKKTQSFGDILLDKFNALFQKRNNLQDQDAVRMKEELMSLREAVKNERKGINDAIVEKGNGLVDDYKNKVITSIEQWLKAKWGENAGPAKELFNSMLLAKFSNGKNKFDEGGYSAYLEKNKLTGFQNCKIDDGHFVLDVSSSHTPEMQYPIWLKGVSDFNIKNPTHLKAMATLIFEKNEGAIVNRLSSQVDSLNELDMALDDAIGKLAMLGNTDLLKGVKDPSRSLVATKFVTEQDISMAEQMVKIDNYAGHDKLKADAIKWYDGLDEGVKKIAVGEHTVEMDGHKARVAELNGEIEKAKANIAIMDDFAKLHNIDKLSVGQSGYDPELNFTAFNDLYDEKKVDVLKQMLNKKDPEGFNKIIALLSNVENGIDGKDPKRVFKDTKDLLAYYNKLGDKLQKLQDELKEENAKYRSDETLELHLKAFAVKKRMDDNLLNKLNSEVGVIGWVLNNGVDNASIPKDGSIDKFVEGICGKLDAQNDKMLNALASKANYSGTNGVKFAEGDKENIKAGLDKWIGSMVEKVTTESAMPSRSEIEKLHKFGQTEKGLKNHKPNTGDALKVIMSQIADIENGILVKCKSEMGENNPIFTDPGFKATLRNSAKEIWKRHFIGVSIANALDKQDGENSLGENRFADAITALKNNKGDIELKDKLAIGDVLLPHLDAFDNDKAK